MATTREATVDELDVEGEIDRLMFYWGAALVAVEGASVERQQARDAMWRLTPFVKAVAMVARENPGPTRELWADALRSPMPFGGKAIGMPMVADPADRAAGKGD